MELLVLVLVNILTAVIMYLLFSVRFSAAVEKARKTAVVDDLKENIEATIEYINTALELVDTRTRTFYRLLRHSEEITEKLRADIEKLEELENPGRKSMRKEGTAASKKKSTAKKKSAAKPGRKANASKKNSAQVSHMTGDNSSLSAHSGYHRLDRDMEEGEFSNLDWAARILGQEDTTLEITPSGSNSEEIFSEGQLSGSSGMNVSQARRERSTAVDSGSQQTSQGVQSGAAGFFSGIGRVVGRMMGMKPSENLAFTAGNTPGLSPGLSEGSRSGGFDDALGTAIHLSERVKREQEVASGGSTSRRPRTDSLDISGEARSARSTGSRIKDTGSLLAEELGLENSAEEQFTGNKAGPGSFETMEESEESFVTESRFERSPGEIQLSEVVEEPILEQDRLLTQLSDLPVGRERNRVVMQLLEMGVEPATISVAGSISMAEVELMAMMGNRVENKRRIRRN